MEGKKISFGFLKTKKVDKLVEEKKEFIECMEEKSIKVVGGEEVKETAPLVIPLKPNTLVTADRLKQIAEEVESVLTEPEPGEKQNSAETQNVPDNETLDQMVVRELLQEAKKEVKTESMDLTVPIPAKPVMQGQKESTLEDYNDVPVQEFGLAMLRGMGWTADKETTNYKQPQLRPKGLGLGADKVITENQKKKSTTNNKEEEEEAIVKNSFVKITSGKYSGCYGKVVSLDEDNGRVMVDIIVKKETVSLSEFMMQAVTKAEFDKESKVINADFFEEYKRAEKVSQKVSNQVSPKPDKGASSSSKDANYDEKDEKDSKKTNNNEKDEKVSMKPHDDEERGREKSRRRSSEERSRKTHKTKKKKRRHSSSDSLSSRSDSDKRRKHKSSRKRYSSTDSDSDSPKREKRRRTPEKKRDIDKKRKGKKKKRDRDRSPNYRKHRK